MGYDFEHLYKTLTGNELKSYAFEPVPLVMAIPGIKLPEGATVSYVPESEELLVKCKKGYLSVSNMGGIIEVNVKGGVPAEEDDSMTEKVSGAWEKFLDAYKIV